jgi:hypothetical protein
MVAKSLPDPELRMSGGESDVTELCLLLPAWQVGALEQAAQAEGITVAQLLRRVVARTVAQSSLPQAGYYYG